MMIEIGEIETGKRINRILIMIEQNIPSEIVKRRRNEIDLIEIEKTEKGRSQETEKRIEIEIEIETKKGREKEWIVIEEKNQNLNTVEPNGQEMNLRSNIKTETENEKRKKGIVTEEILEEIEQIEQIERIEIVIGVVIEKRIRIINQGTEKENNIVTEETVIEIGIEIEIDQETETETEKDQEIKIVIETKTLIDREHQIRKQQRFRNLLQIRNYEGYRELLVVVQVMINHTTAIMINKGNLMNKIQQIILIQQQPENYEELFVNLINLIMRK
mmetsp:Transcript_24561/g.21464  ORF Transcript_24561/g.21464 Transcript_24561/m.21464 type:complete len:274 (-) Transcript_24561:350-1171(-)